MAEDPDRGGRSRPSAEGQADASDLGDLMGQLARSLQEQHGDVEATLRAITSSAVDSVPGADACGVSLVVDRQRVESRADTSDLPREVDAIQERLGEGPCLDAIWEQQTVHLDDIAQEERWPRFCAEARRAGVGSMLSFQLFVTGDNLGALNLYSRRPHAFTEESETVGSVFASHGSIALAGAQNEEHLRTAMTSRDLIGQAKGILMERFRITGDQAFQVLVRTSSHTNRRLVDIAEELCATGALPTSRGDQPA